jgi:integrase
MLVDLALSTGLRVSEIAALNIRDVDLKTRLSVSDSPEAEGECEGEAGSGQ